jgi:hypothetical protein
VSEASIDFQGLPSLLDLDQATIEAEAGRTLSITVNGAPRDMHLATSGAGLTGDGSLAGNFNLSNGAAVAPGSSPGTLTIVGDLELGPGAVYEWEIDDLAAEPGVGWDLLDVEGALAFSATPESPWILEVNVLENALALGGSEWLIASATTIDGFDPASVQVTLGNASDPFRRLAPDQLSIELRGADLYLVRTVPEPASLPVIALMCLMLSIHLRSRQ